MLAAGSDILAYLYADRVSEPPSQETPRRPIPGPDVTIREMLTDRRALTDGLVTPLLFLTVNSLAGLVPAAITAGAWGFSSAVYRLIRRQKVRFALSGLLGLGVALLVALRTGRAATYFLPNVVFGYINGAIGLVSVVIAKPVSAILVRLVEGKPHEWYEAPRVRQTHQIVTAAWSVLFILRATVRAVLIAQDSEWGLAVTTFTLGLPATALMVVGSWAFVKRRLRTDHTLGAEGIE